MHRLRDGGNGFVRLVYYYHQFFDRVAFDQLCRLSWQEFLERWGRIPWAKAAPTADGGGSLRDFVAFFVEPEPSPKVLEAILARETIRWTIQHSEPQFAATILKIPVQEEKAADKLALITATERKTESPDGYTGVTTEGHTMGGVSRVAAGWPVKAGVAAVIAVIVAGLITILGSIVPASALAVAPVLAIAALLCLRHNRKKEAGGCR
jgi:hypothetical protein